MTVIVVVMIAFVFLFALLAQVVVVAVVLRYPLFFVVAIVVALFHVSRYTRINYDRKIFPFAVVVTVGFSFVLVPRIPFSRVTTRENEI